MTSIPNAISLLQIQSVSRQNRISDANAWNLSNLPIFRCDSCQLGRIYGRSRWVFLVRASEDSLASGDNESAGDGARVEVERNGFDSETTVGALRRTGARVEVKRNEFDSERTVSALRGTIAVLTPAIFTMKRNIGSKFAIGLYIALAFFMIAARQLMLRKRMHNPHGSVAELVKRGQLRSDRRGISKPLKYEDPFNNPLVKVGKSNSTIEMCGKVYRLAPVTLTEEEQSIHQRRRSRAYQWKRPKIFLKEGDAIPEDVDPDTVRWIPANHPFATTVSDIDEDLAQSNVYQKHGVPSRIKAEHEALQKKLGALQNEQKLNKGTIDSNSIRDYERPFKPSSKPHEQLEPRPSSQQYGVPLKSDQELDSGDKKTSSDMN